MQIDALAYSSRLANIRPQAKIIFGLVALALCLCWNSFAVSIAAILLMSALSVCRGGMLLSRYLRLLSIPLAFLLLGAITIIIGRYPPHTSMLLELNVFNSLYGVTAESLLLGLGLILRALGMVCCMYFISVNTPMNDLLSALRAWKLPVLLVSLTELIYRYIFVFVEEAGRIRRAQDSRLGYVSFKTALRSTGQLAAMLFLRVYLRCDSIYAALESRGYAGEFKTIARAYAPSRRMYLALIPLTLGLSLLGALEKFYLG